jgi:hypothetical protein
MYIRKGEIYTQDMAFLHVYQNGILHGAATIYYQQLVPQGRNIPRDMAFLRISEWDLHSAPLATCSSTREKYTPRDMAFLHVYIRMGSTRCR